MPDTVTLVDVIQRDRQAMVRTMTTLAFIGQTQRAEAIRPDQVMSKAVPLIHASVAATQAASTIRALLIAGGVTADEMAAIAEGIDREAAVLASLEATG